MLPFGEFILLFGFICVIAYELLGVLRTQFLWQREVQIDRALAELSDRAAASWGIQDYLFGEAELTAEIRRDLVPYMATWNHAFVLVFKSGKKVSRFQILGGRDVAKFCRYISDTLSEMLNGVERALLDERTSGLVFRGGVVSNDDILKYVHQFRTGCLKLNAALGHHSEQMEMADA